MGKPMATDSARSTAPPAARHLWQVPALLAGMAAVVAVLAFRPDSSADTVAAAQRQLHEARKSLEQSPPDSAGALQRADRILSLADRYPQLTGEAHFLAGSAHLRLADEPGADTARERQLARQHLELAATHGVPETDRLKLDYRLAKIGLLLGSDPAKAATSLESSAEADNPAEAYGLLAQAYTRMTPPDLPKAEKAARQQLDLALRTSNARAQASARFLLGKLYLQLKKDKDGRQMLSRVDQEAPPDEFYAARVMLAESYEASQEWAGAHRNWEKARENPKLSDPEKAKVLYHLGRCLALDQRKEAAGVFEEAVKLGGPEGQAAGLRLAELQLEGEPAGAAAALAAAMGSVHTPDDYRNPLVTVDEVRSIAERLTQAAREKADWDTARKAVEAYAAVAPPGKDDELAGQVFAAQGQTLAEKAKGDATLEEQARETYRQASAAYERAAGKAPDPPVQATWLWQSAELALKAGQSVRARDILTRATQLQGALTPEKTAEAWLLIGNTDQLNQHTADARTAYQKCLTLPGPFALKARLSLARLDIAENHFDDAEQALQDLLKLIREAPQPDTELQEQALFEWAEVAYQRQATVKEDLREFATAEQRLIGALQQYPDGAAAIRARIMLGKCYWNDARTKDRPLERVRAGVLILSEDERKAYQRQRDEFLKKAAEQYDAVEQKLLSRQRDTGRLTPQEASWLKVAAFEGTDCYLYSTKYDEAIRRFDSLAQRYQGVPEGLIALSNLYNSYIYDRQPEKARETIKRLQEAVEKMPDEAFTGLMETHKRQYWLELLKAATKPAVPPAPANAASAK
jgi:tetratricopeptide (TPR) repeat protein